LVILESKLHPSRDERSGLFVFGVIEEEKKFLTMSTSFEVADFEAKVLYFQGQTL
jgi:hypothetical protein